MLKIKNYFAFMEKTIDESKQGQKLVVTNKKENTKNCI